MISRLRAARRACETITSTNPDPDKVRQRLVKELGYTFGAEQVAVVAVVDQVTRKQST